MKEQYSHAFVKFLIKRQHLCYCEKTAVFQEMPKFSKLPNSSSIQSLNGLKKSVDINF